MKHDRTFWIDSICINQEDDEERTQQVSIMRMIYQQASKVTIWLGEEDEETSLGMTLLERFGSIQDEPVDRTPLRSLTKEKGR